MQPEINTFTEYISFYNDSINKYGPKTALLYQCGSFYEFYGVNNETEKLGNIEGSSREENIKYDKFVYITKVF